MKIILLWILILLQLSITTQNPYDDALIVKPSVYTRHTIRPFEQKPFKINQADLEKNTKYEVRISFLGNIGAEMVLKWKNIADINFHTMTNPSFRPLDTANLFFKTNEYSEITEAYSECIEKDGANVHYNFFVFMYRNSLARSKELADRPAEFYITILPVVIPGLGYNVVGAYGLAIIITVLILWLILPKTIKKIPYFSEFLVRDYDPLKRTR